jgi:hypothetical protein
VKYLASLGFIFGSIAAFHFGYIHACAEGWLIVLGVAALVF